MVEVFNNKEEVARAIRSTIYGLLSTEYSDVAKLYAILEKDNRRISCIARINKHKEMIEKCERFLKMSNDELLVEFSECWGVL